MKLISALALLLVGTPALAQITPTPPLPPANALPPPESEEGQVLAPINALFAALAARDSQAILAQVRPEGSVTVANEKPDGTHAIRHETLGEFAAGLKPGPEKYAERLIAPAVEIDGDIAMVWGSYVFTVDGKVVHCGVDHFSLFRENGRWKIGHIAWSARTTGCDQ